MKENSLFNNVYNPDVLSCIANLSNDEVFTPPSLANKMLDMLPQELFENPDTTFLDPCCKSGVFLREIAKRLIKGLEKQIPDLEKRIEHIFSKQLYGIAITELTSLLSRRSVYCSKFPSGEYSVYQFPADKSQGNLIYERIQHTWQNGKCIYCGASQSEYDRGDELETHAYQFIHNIDLNQVFHMKFDVIIGNPPYQLSDGGGIGSSAMPIYHKFVETAIKLNPRFLTMIIPSRWFSGGRGLDDFRDKMLHDDRIRVLHDFIDASDCFPGVEIKGGVCYFLWKNNERGLCHVMTHVASNIVTESVRPLLEPNMKTFLRYHEQISILHKVHLLCEKTFDEIITSNDPFGFDIRFEGSYKRVKPNYTTEKFNEAVKFYYNGWRREGIGYIGRSEIRKNQNLIDAYKIFIPKAWGVGDSRTDILNAFYVEPNSVCTETYLSVGPFVSENEAKNALTYMQGRFFHFMVSMLKITQNSMKNVYSLVPLQDFSKPWTDEELYAKYGLTQDEINFIESMIRPME